jgi:hypothetical protein
MTDILIKALMGKEDLLLGAGSETQTRDSTGYTINKINSATIPYDGTALGGTAATTKEMITPVNIMEDIMAALMTDEVRIAKEYVDVDGLVTKGDGRGGRYYWNPTGEISDHDGLTVIDPDNTSTITVTAGQPWFTNTGSGSGTTGAWERVDALVSSGTDGKTTIKSVGTATANADLDVTPAGTGDVNITTGDVILADGAVSASTTVTAGTGITTTTGGVTATAGGVTATAGGVTATAGDITADAGNLVLTAGGIKVTNEAEHYAVKRLAIGDWDMDASDDGDLTKTLAHGLAIADIMSVSIIIIRDDSAFYYDFLNDTAGIIAFDGTNIYATQTAAGYFDTINFANPSFNRGYITVMYLI